ncbi:MULTISPECIES: helix-turn-helix domain-containing protein [unclassified Kitasatospora]|uniref:helix-turn-helix domain-containing protein n=1 Tax=unclassified Kitasatospora TaxID=2633591 RepID=UPI000710B436|nr:MULTISPECIES: helix-turn-helix domain-containing protein [unclassified Kitasatospora]KQV21783.1 AraC family transcriptional regulator [Kitasatospora sp. Root107]KRB75425.1 AraC family transcriptional regulator [Kitasatospora sp. Root187]
MHRHRIACLAFDGMAPFELATVAEVFAVSRPELDVDWWYRFELCAETPGPHRVVGGFDIVVHHGLDRLRYADTVIVPGVADVRRDVSPVVLDALREASARGARVVSICSGAFALAAAGLLDGKEATTHWRHARLLQERHPEVTVNASVLYVDSGSVVTAAGTAAGIDVCLHLIRKDHGAEVAARVARRMVVASHREGGQAQFAEHPVGRAPSDDPIGHAIRYALDSLHRRLTVDELAGVAHLSVRQFERRFVDTTGLPPGRWITQQRIRAGAVLLESADHPIDTVAGRVGLTVAGFRHHFRETMGISPSAYRRQYQR